MTDIAFENILYEKNGAIAVITINREKGLNAMDARTSRELFEAMAAYRDDDDLRAAVLTGTGPRSFSTGMDLVASAAGENQLEKGNLPVGGFTKRFPLHKPVIAAINGFCLAGGLELALACDIRICVPEARFALAEVKWALIPGSGGTQRLPRAVPQAWANYMILTGEQVDAETAKEIGLVSHIIPQEELMDRALEIGGLIAERGPLAIKAAKEVILRGLDVPLDHGLALEDEVIFRIIETEDAKEGPRAFAEKRPPVYRGR
ncbi:MAG TPA: enoyl-CoA hydratase-related protein [Dehalococcoidia bacterium]|jgi:E-phenylitaconyl-CoA hydratase|nr:enoyl-CoA hydratase-related protein [Dehalococcoidia bacterium]